MHKLKLGINEPKTNRIGHGGGTGHETCFKPKSEINDIPK